MTLQNTAEANVKATEGTGSQTATAARTGAPAPTGAMHKRLTADLARISGLTDDRVKAAVCLLDEGNTVPFIARYRKDQTGNLSDGDLRLLVREKDRLLKLYEKQADTLRLLTEAGHLTAALERKILTADRTSTVEELYRPFRPKRRTRATVAKEQGLEPLARLLQAGRLEQARLLAADLGGACQAVADSSAAWQGAADILAEELSDQPTVRTYLRKRLSQDQNFTAARTAYSKTEEGAHKARRYQTYLDFKFSPRRLKGYQILALRRAEAEDLVKVNLKEETDLYVTGILRQAEQDGFFHSNSAAAAELQQAVALDSWKRLLKPSLVTEVKNDLLASAEAEALDIFAGNLFQALLAPPLRNHTVLAFDPGFRNGCKLAVTDPRGSVLETAVIYPVPPQKREPAAAARLDELLCRHPVSVLALGNGTATRETEAFIRSWQAGDFATQLTADQAQKRKALPLVIVNEAGASVYSASAVGAAEFPDLAVELRSAVSLARRLQDPLAELVKIEPEAIGVGQYQHDISQKQLRQRLGEVVEAAVNLVGADLNTASPALLGYIAGLNSKTAEQIALYRQAKGGFKNRSELLKVKGLGPKAYEQCAGFLRVASLTEPLDNTFIHPESYDIARQLLNYLVPATELESLRQKLVNGAGSDLTAAADRFGRKKLAANLAISTGRLNDLLDDLAKAGRDDRADLELVSRSDAVTDIDDLAVGMVLKGTVRNIVQFGAFVDIGVHQDGLIHISEMANHFVSDPAKICRVGQVLEVKVIGVDLEQNRIALSLKQV